MFAKLFRVDEEDILFFRGENVEILGKCVASYVKIYLYYFWMEPTIESVQDANFDEHLVFHRMGLEI